MKRGGSGEGAGEGRPTSKADTPGSAPYNAGMDALLDILGRYKYAAMFGILFLCGLGLPIPEEVTLLGSGLAVGWKQADFWLASIACVLGILAGDGLIFLLGRIYGRKFLGTALMRWVLTEKRQAKIHNLFAKHGAKAVFFARFFAGVRIGVYAYAGQHGMSLVRFLFLDFLGALISGPTSIFIGKFAAEKLAEPEEAKAFARQVLREGHTVIYILVGVLVLSFVIHWAWQRRGRRQEKDDQGPPGGGSAGVQEEAGMVVTVQDRE
jgi:membrane protein DedA with SNARE-associated domain